MTEKIISPRFDSQKFLQDVSHLTIPEYILEKTRKWAEDGKTAMMIDTVTGETHLYADFDHLTKKIGSSLYKRGMRKGGTAIYLTYDMVHLPAFCVGVWRANGIMRASYPEDDTETLLDRVEESKAGWLLCDPDLAERCLLVASKVTWDVEVIVVGKADGCTSLKYLFEDDGQALPPLELTPDDIALIMCTSGTTGKSKGASHSHKGLSGIMETMKYFPFTSDKPNLIISKGTHISGSVFPLGALCIGKTILVMAKVTKDDVFKAVHTYRPGFVWGFPPFLLTLVNDPDAAKYDFSSLEIAASGGAPVTTAIKSTLMRLPSLKVVYTLYGATEAFPLCSDIDVANPLYGRVPGTPEASLGRPCVGTIIKIRDSETGESLGPNQRGEICVKSRNILHSYYKNPEATEKAFEDDWFLTGDIGYYDENGFLFHVDRFKEVFKYYGNHVSPNELEEVIEKHPAVAEVCVVGVPDPNGGDHIPRAFLTLKHGVDEVNWDTIAKDIQEFANEKLADYKHLRGGVYVLPELPKGKTGKITRQLVAKMPIPART